MRSVMGLSSVSEQEKVVKVTILLGLQVAKGQMLQRTM